MLDNVKVVLVGTSHSGNIGSAARAMKVMGLSQLVLVDPQCEVDEQTLALAAGAGDIAENATIVSTLDEAVKDCGLVVGSSARSRTLEWPMLEPRECGQKFAVEGQKHPVALVFGRERTGLTNDELQKCHFHVCIPANPEYDVLMEALDIIKAENITFLLAVGGGSVIDGTKFLSAAALTANNAETSIDNFSENLFAAYQLADCDNEDLFYEAYYASINNASSKSSLLSEARSLMLESCEECPSLQIAPLQGIIGYPQVNELSLCSAADTISMLVFNSGECPVENLFMTINFDAGLSYGGFVEDENGKPISEFDTSDPSNPRFLITNMDSAEVYIVYFGVKANCDINPTSTDPVNFDVTYEHSYENTTTGTMTCTGVESEISDYSNGIKVPVLNVLNVSPTTR